MPQEQKKSAEARPSHTAGSHSEPSPVVASTSEVSPDEASPREVTPSEASPSEPSAAAASRKAPGGRRVLFELSLQAEELLGWLAVEKGRSRNTLAAYRRDLVGYESWLQGQGVDGVGDVGEETVALYISHLRASGLAPASVARAMVAVRSLHKFLVREGASAADPTSGLRPPSVPQGLPKALSEGEVTSLLEAVTGGARHSAATGRCWSCFTGQACAFPS